MSWIFFDQSASQKLGKDLGLAPSEMHEASGDAVLCALEQPRPSLVLLPGETIGQVVLLQVRRPRLANLNAAGDGHEPVAYRSSGFLGLNDEPIYFDDNSPPRRRWWQRKGK
jgi:hypothetical protein